MSDKNKFQDSFDIEGFWWFPDNPERKVAGILHHTPSGFNLHLMGTLTDLTTFQNQFEYEIIHGVSTEGKPITLYKCITGSYTANLPQYAISNYNVLMIFQGVHFSKKEDIKFSQIHSHLTHFDEWVGVSGFNVDVEQMKKGIFGMTYTQPQEIKFELDENFSSSIFFGVSHHFEHVGEKRQEIHQRIVLSIESHKQTSFFEFQDKLSDIRKFLSFACQKSIHPIDVTCIIESHDDTSKQNSKSRIQIYFQQFDMSNTIKEIHSMNMLFTYRDIHENLSHYFKIWFENKSLLEPTYNIYFGIIDNNHMYLDQEFLQLSHALESYHRRTSDQTEVDQETHRTRINSIITSIPKEYQEWLKNKLSFSNEISLRTRLGILLEQFPFVLENYDDDKKPFMKFIVDTRNYLTHYSNNAKENLDDIHKLHKICLRMKLLIEACLFHKLGFEQEKIKLLIKQSQRIKGLDE
ncbi:MAG: hypothetical protein JKY53_15005 [Flavobacteriales bacterium]|nr:hypothetical protein [Flavobacteriales bacterium]